MNKDLINDLDDLDVPEKQIEALKDLIQNKRKKDIKINCAILIIFLTIIILLIYLIQILNLFNLQVDEGIIVNETIFGLILALVSAFSPIRIIQISRNDITKIFNVEPTRDFMIKIEKSIKSIISKLERWLAICGACGIFISAILKFLIPEDIFLLILKFL